MTAKRIRTSPREILVEAIIDTLNLISSHDLVYLHRSLENTDEDTFTVDKIRALRLSSIFGMSADIWINLQKNYDESKHEVTV